MSEEYPTCETCGKPLTWNFAGWWSHEADSGGCVPGLQERIAQLTTERDQARAEAAALREAAQAVWAGYDLADEDEAVLAAVDRLTELLQSTTPGDPREWAQQIAPTG